MSGCGEDRAWRPRLAAVGLVLVQCAALSVLTEGHLFAAVAGGLALLSLVRRCQLAPENAPHGLWSVLLGLLVAIKYRLAPEELPEQVTFFNTSLGYEAARYLIVLQVMPLYVQRPSGRLPTWVAGLACLSLALASNVRLSSANAGVSQGLCLTFVILLAWFAHANRTAALGGGRRLARGLLAGVAAAAALAGVAVASLIRHYEDDVAAFLAEPGHTLADREVARGFSGRGAIGDITGWKQHAADHIALRIHAPAPPGYLRGMVFDEFHEENYWSATADQRSLGTVESSWLQLRRSGEDVYALTDRPAGPLRGGSLDVWPDERTGSRLFAPLEAVYLATATGPVAVNSHGLPVRPEKAAAAPFTLFLAEGPVPVDLSPSQRELCLRVRPELELELHPWTQHVFVNCRTTADKLKAVVQFFHEGFRYDLLPQPRRWRNVVLDFLEHRRAGHCELFATSGALLLRMAGVPTRYVTGYVATERNHTGGYWVARREHAHAWVEAYDDERRQWVTVECTPPDGVPQAGPAGGWADWWDAQQLALKAWSHRLLHAGAGGVVALLASVPGLAVLLSSVAAILLWKHRRRVRVARRPAVVVDDPALARVLRRGDRLARRLGCRRAPGETLSAFARRLRDASAAADVPSSLADWYEEYIRVRYGKPQPGDPCGELWRRLRSAAAALKAR